MAALLCIREWRGLFTRDTFGSASRISLLLVTPPHRDVPLRRPSPERHERAAGSAAPAAPEAPPPGIQALRRRVRARFGRPLQHRAALLPVQSFVVAGVECREAALGPA